MLHVGPFEMNKFKLSTLPVPHRMIVVAAVLLALCFRLLFSSQFVSHICAFERPMPAHLSEMQKELESEYIALRSVSAMVDQLPTLPIRRMSLHDGQD